MNNYYYVYLGLELTQLYTLARKQSLFQKLSYSSWRHNSCTVTRPVLARKSGCIGERPTVDHFPAEQAVLPTPARYADGVRDA